MVLENNDSPKLLPISAVIEDCSTWFSQVAFVVAYHDDKASQRPVENPVGFQKWHQEAQNQGVLTPDVLKNCNDIYHEMLRLGQDLVQLVQINKRPSLMGFEDFQGIYTGFLSRMRRVERDSGIAGSGIDAQTGLRSYDVAPLDLKKEIERLSRQKVPFALLMTRLDGFNDDPKTLKVVVESIKECMRSFDDAYYCDNGYFLVSLKHSDVSGAQALANRLKQAITEHSEAGVEITLSHCLTEPVVGDDVEELLTNMRQDLEDHKEESDSILKFIEVSPLQRFVDNKDS